MTLIDGITPDGPAFVGLDFGPVAARAAIQARLGPRAARLAATFTRLARWCDQHPDSLDDDTLETLDSLLDAVAALVFEEDHAGSLG